MYFSIGGLQALALIETDLSRTTNGNFSTTNVRLMGQALSLMISKIWNAAMNLVNKAETVKKLRSCLYL